MLFSEDGVPFQANATLEDIYVCFRLLLGRYPSRPEWIGHSARVGEPLDRVVSTYLNSLEFFNRRLQQAQPEAIQLASLDGFCLYASPDDCAVGKHILAARDYEPNVSRIFRQAVKTGMHVLDIGANIGFYTMLGAALAGPSGSVWAVEPNPRNVRMIVASAARNRFSNVRVVQAAAGERWEVMALFTDGSNATVASVFGAHPSMIPEPVMALPLGAVLGDSRVDVVKVDVEGAEGSALRGMVRILERDRPVIFSELTPGAMPRLSGMTADEYLGFLAGFGYRFSVLMERPIDCGRDVNRVMDCFRVSGLAHVDIRAQC